MGDDSVGRWRESGEILAAIIPDRALYPDHLTLFGKRHRHGRTFERLVGANR
jgi:hypothetical protein